MRIILCVVLLFIIVVPVFAAMPVDSSLINRKPFSAPSWVGMRSFLIPGWGQFYNGKTIKAIVIAGGQLGMGYGIYRQDRKYRDNIHLRDATTDTFAKQDYDAIARFYANDRNKLIWWSAGGMFLSVFDAFVDAHLKQFDVGPTMGLDGEPKVSITFKW